MVDNGGSVPPTKNTLDESSSDSSSNINSVQNNGGKDVSKNEPVQTEVASSQISTNSVFGKGLGKQPFDFEKIAQIYDKQNNVIDLVPGAGLCFFFIYYYIVFRSGRWNYYFRRIL
jgi:hypothetical protein